MARWQEDNNKSKKEQFYWVLDWLDQFWGETQVSEALGRGAEMDDVMSVIGHSRIETTLRYDHSAMSRMKRAMEALESRIGK